uniref:hypothetical protein n=3 Tax=Enterobacteriaceae TaxID=543 RepID=UPI001BC8B10A
VADQENTPLWGEESRLNPVKIEGIFDLRRKRTRFNNTKTEQYARLFRRKGHLMLMKRFQCKLML